MNKTLLKIATFGVLATTAALPTFASAQSYRQHRDQKKNEWKNIGIGAAAVGLYGLIKGDRNLTIAGAAGAAYSAYRYSQDSRDNNRYDRYGYNRSGYDRYGYNRSGYDRYGYNHDGYDRSGRRRNNDRRDNDRWDNDRRDDHWNGRGPGNSDWGHSRGNHSGRDRH